MGCQKDLPEGSQPSEGFRRSGRGGGWGSVRQEEEVDRARAGEGWSLIIIVQML